MPPKRTLRGDTMVSREDLHKDVTGEAAEDENKFDSFENVMPPDYSSEDERPPKEPRRNSTSGKTEEPIFDDSGMAHVMPGGFLFENEEREQEQQDREQRQEQEREGGQERELKQERVGEPETISSEPERRNSSLPPSPESEPDNEPSEDPSIFNRFTSLIGMKGSPETTLSDPIDEVKRLRSRLEKSEKLARKAEKSAAERDLALAEAQKKLSSTSSRLREYEAIASDNFRTIKKLNDQIGAAKREVRKRESDLDEERYYRRRQGEEFKRLADDKRDGETRGKEKEKELSEKVFELTGGTFNATQDQLRGMLQSWRGGINNLAPSFFTRIADLRLDEEGDEQARYFCENLDEMDFKILTAYGSEVYYYLCESWLFRSILEHNTNVFCVGTREALCHSGTTVDEGLRILHDVIELSPQKDIPDAKSLQQTWRSTTTRILLSFQQIALPLLADKSSHPLLLSRSTVLAEAITNITQKVALDTSRYLLPSPARDVRTPRKMKKLFDVVAAATLLRINCRVHSEELTFKLPRVGERVDGGWMECVGDVAAGTGRDADGGMVVLISISAALMVRRRNGDWDVVAKARVFPVTGAEMRRVREVGMARGRNEGVEARVRLGEKCGEENGAVVKDQRGEEKKATDVDMSGMEDIE